MSECRKCGKPLPEGAKFCAFCGTSIKPKPRRSSKRGNGQGSAIKRGKTWTARVVVGWKKVGEDSQERIPVYRTKGGFASRTDALNYCPTLVQITTVPKDIVFSDLYEKWKTEYEPRIVPGTMGCYKAAYKHFKSIHYRKMRSILATDLQECIDKCPAGKRTKENMKALASLMWKYAFNNDLVEKNVADYLYTGNDTTTTRKPFTMDEVAVLHDAFDREKYAPYVYINCYLGFRPGELLALTKEAYNVKEGYIIGGSKTEAGIDRIVTVPDRIKPVLARQMELVGTDLLFPREVINRKGEFTGYKQMSDNYFRRHIFDPMMERLGIKDRVPYSCRHTYANLLKDADGADTDKAALMGHTDYAMTKYYQSADLDHLREITKGL